MKDIDGIVIAEYNMIENEKNQDLISEMPMLLFYPRNNKMIKSDSMHSFNSLRKWLKANSKVYAKAFPNETITEEEEV